MEELMPITSFMIVLSLLFSFTVSASNLVTTIAKIKPSVVGVGVYTPLGQPKNQLNGTGFVVGNGNYVVTNHHVLPKLLDEELLQQMVVFIGQGKSSSTRKAKVVAVSKKYDLAILEITGKALPALKLASDNYIAEGSDVAFTGFPIGAVLGLYPVTHSGIIASITPTITPVTDVKQLSIKMLRTMKDPYLVYQLDATAYPGNSGSALYDVNNGQVVAVINKVFVQGSKEAAISNPSGITYAIPVRYVRELFQKNKLSL